LDLKRLKSAYSSENIAELVLEILYNYEITEKLDFFTLDNVSLNDICLEIFLRDLLPNITADELKIRRLRYFGYIFNLAAKVFLFNNNTDAFEVEIE